MPSGTMRRRIGLLAVSLIAAATVSVGTHAAAAANVRHTRHTYPSHAYTVTLTQAIATGHGPLATRRCHMVRSMDFCDASRRMRS